MNPPTAGPISSRDGGDEAAGPPRWRYAWAILKRHFGENQLLLRATALTYATLLSAVPFLAVALSVLRALGIEDRLLPFLAQRLEIAGEKPAEVLLDAAQRLDPAALGAAGAVGLLFASLLLLAQVDGAYNAIWGVRENRPITTRLLGYGGLLVLGPMWIAIWTTLMSSLRLAAEALPGILATLGVVITRGAGPVLALLVLTALNRLTPNTHVRWQPAFLGALLSTALLEFSQALFVTWIRTSVAYDIVYGAFAALPVFLAWVYLNWLAVLLGVEATYLLQNIPTWLREAEEPETLAWEERERLALASAALLARYDDEVLVDRLAADLEVSPRLVHRPLNDLEDSGWVVPVRDERGQVCAYRPRKLLVSASLAEVRRSLRGLGERSHLGARQRAIRVEPRWMSVLEPLEREGDRPFETTTVLELARRLAGETGAPPPEVPPPAPVS